MQAVDRGYLCNLGPLPDDFLQGTIYFVLCEIEFHSRFIGTERAAQGAAAGGDPSRREF
jgi:hypothetical protein